MVRLLAFSGNSSHLLYQPNKEVGASKPYNQDRYHVAGQGGDEGLEQHVGDGGHLTAYTEATGEQSLSANSFTSHRAIHIQWYMVEERAASGFLDLKLKKCFLVLGFSKGRLGGPHS